LHDKFEMAALKPEMVWSFTIFYLSQDVSHKNKFLRATVFEFDFFVGVNMGALRHRLIRTVSKYNGHQTGNNYVSGCVKSRRETPNKVSMFSIFSVTAMSKFNNVA